MHIIVQYSRSVVVWIAPTDRLICNIAGSYGLPPSKYSSNQSIASLYLGAGFPEAIIAARTDRRCSTNGVIILRASAISDRNVWTEGRNQWTIRRNGLGH